MLHSAMQQFASFLPKDLYIAGGKLFSASAIGPGPVKDASVAFLKAAKASHELPDIGNNLPWDPALIITDALRTLGPDAKATEIRDFIVNLHNFAGSNGFYDFRTGDQRGVGLKDVIITRWSTQANTWLPVSTSRGELLPNSPR